MHPALLLVSSMGKFIHSEYRRPYCLQKWNVLQTRLSHQGEKKINPNFANSKPLTNTPLHVEFSAFISMFGNVAQHVHSCLYHSIKCTPLNCSRKLVLFFLDYTTVKVIFNLHSQLLLLSFYAVHLWTLRVVVF